MLFRPALRVIALLTMASALSGFGSCKKPGAEGEKKNDVPPSATPVPSPTLGIATGTPVIIPPAAPGLPAGAPASFAPLARATQPAGGTIVIKV
jgi:hypothetical protein